MSNSSSSSSAASANKVLIIGGGIAGLAQALFLQHIGVEAEVFEAYPAGKIAMGGGMQLAPNGMNVLKFLGLDDALEKRGSVIRRYVMTNHLHETIASIPIPGKEKFGSNSVCVSRLNLHRTLLEGIERAGIRVSYDRRLASISEDSDSVTATFEDGSSARGFMLIGADGVHSLTRRNIFPQAPGPFFLGLIGYGGFVPKEFLASVPESCLPHDGEMSFAFGPTGFFGQCDGGKDDLGRETVMWWSNQPVSEPGGDGMAVKKLLDAKSNEEIKAELHALHEGWFDPCTQLISNDSVHPSGQRMVRQQVHDLADLKEWSKGRVLLIGDAAHAMSPNSGQGASQALEDTMQLAKILKDAGLGGAQAGITPSQEQLTRAFAQFQSIRKPRVDAINAAARQMASHKTAKLGPWACWFRDRFLKVLFWCMGDSFITKNMSYKIEWDNQQGNQQQ